MNRRNKLLVLVLLALVGLSALSPAMRAQDTQRAALVVRFDDNTVAMQCIVFSEPQITGYDLLTRSDQSIVAQFQGSQGAAICAIGGTGCPADDCFCQCKSGDDCTYWSYFRQVGGSWQYSQQGALAAEVTDGSVDGWSWGPGSLTGAIAPPDVTFEEVCGPPNTPTSTPILITPLATDTRRATAVPIVVPNSPTPTRTVQPADTAVPTAGPATATRPPAATVTHTATAFPPGGERVPDLPPTNTPEGVDAPLVTDVAPVQPATPAQPSGTLETPVGGGNGAVPEPALSAVAATPVGPIVIAVVTPAPREAATVIGAESVPPTAVAAAPPPPAAQASGPVTWVPYVIFLLIVAALGLLLIIAQRRRRNG